MKKVYKDKIVNIENTDKFDNKFLFEYLIPNFFYFNVEGSFGNEIAANVETIYMSELLEKRKNKELLTKLKDKPAMYSNVYSPKDEFEIFENLFNNALESKKKIHIVGITLKEEIELLEKYYEELGFFNKSINVFQVDFSIPLITVSVHIENLMWKGSDYKRMREKIFFNPPIRESGQTKALFKGINRGVTAGIYFSTMDGELTNGKKDFLQTCIKEEHILPITLAKILKYNLKEIGFSGETKELVINY